MSAHGRAAKRRARRGANAIEFALILPALLLMLFGIFEVSWAFNRLLLVNSAAQRAGRFAAMALEDDDPQAMAQERVTEFFDPLGIQSATVTTTVTGASPNRTVRVDVQIPYTSLTSYIPGFPSQLQARSVFRMEDQP